jgi:hypothetical protein
MKKLDSAQVLLVACVCSLAALAMMAWSLFDPRPIPVVAAMSVGQALGTLSFVSFLYVVARDLRRKPSASAGRETGDQRVE